MFKILKLSNDAIYSVLKRLIMILLPAMSIMVFSQVIARFMGKSLAWSEELSTYCFSWLTYFGAAVVLRDGEHVSVMAPINAITNLTIRKLVLVISQLLIMIFVCYSSYLALTLVAQFHVNDLRAVNLESIKMSYVFMQVPVSYIIFGLFSLEKIIEIIQDEPLQDSDGSFDGKESLLEESV